MSIKAELYTRGKSILRWVGIAMDFFFFFRKHGHQFCSAMFLPWRFYTHLPKNGHWRYFWSSVALPTVLFYSAIIVSSREVVDLKWISGLIDKLVQPFLNALLAAVLLEITVSYSAVLYLTFSLVVCVFTLGRLLQLSISSRRFGKRSQWSWYEVIRRASFILQGLREYGKALLYSSGTVAVLFCCVLVAEHVFVGMMEPNSKTTQSILSQLYEHSPIVGKKYAAIGRGEKTDRYQSLDKSQLFNLQPFQRHFGLCSLWVVAIYIFLSMFTTYRSWLLSGGKIRVGKLGSLS